MRPRSSVARCLLLGAEQRAQVVVVDDLRQLDVAVAVGDVLLQRGPPQRRPPGSASPAATASAASRATSVRAARSCGLALRRAGACRSSSAPWRSPCARARASASACHSAASSRSRAASPRSVAARVSSSASVASMRAARASSSARSAPQPLQRLARVLPALRRLRRRDLQRGQLADRDVDLVGQRQPCARAARPRAPRASSAGARVVLEAGAPPRPGAARSRSAARAELGALARRAARAAPRRRSPSWTARSRSFLRPNSAISSARSAAAASSSAASVAAACLRSIWRASAASRSASSRAITCFELADLALLLQHAGQRRLARAAGDHALRIDDLALERDDGLVGARLAPERQRASQILHDQHVAEQVGRDLVVLPVVADQLEHRPAHALALRPGRRDRVAVDDRHRTGVGRRPRRLRRRTGSRRRRPRPRCARTQRRGMKDERPSLRLLEELDRLDAHLVRLDDDVAEPLAQHRLDRGLQLGRRLHDVGHDAPDAGRRRRPSRGAPA